MAGADQSESSEAADKADLEPVVDGTATSIQAHLECDYTLSELKRVDNLLFTKYKVRELGLLYACISIYVCAVPAIICYLFNKELAGGVLNTCLLWSPLLIPFCIAHTWSIYKARIQSLEEAFKVDGHLSLELTEQGLVVRSQATNNNYSWLNFSKCLSTIDHYICLHNSGPIIIPKRLLEDPLKAACVELLLRLKISDYQEVE